MKMDELEHVVWDECVHRRPAPDEAVRERWEQDRFTAYQEHFVIQPLPARYDGLLAQALSEWARHQDIFLTQSRMTQEEFDRQFPVLRQGFLERNRQIFGTVMRLGAIAHGAVRNMDLVNCFACFLPRAVPDRRIALAETGRCMAAIFYLEKMGKAVTYFELGQEVKTDLIDAAWRFADELTRAQSPNPVD